MELTTSSKLNGIIADVLGDAAAGFERVHKLAVAVDELRALLTPEYMAPIMKLQGSRLGFRTDRDKNQDGSKGPGYSMEIVKDCLIEAVLMGLQPFGNMFNIIASGMYITKEGYGYLLKHMPELNWWKVTQDLPKVNPDWTSASVTVKIEYSQNGVVAVPVSFPVAVKVNKGMGVDAILGKAMRKARKWLHEAVTGNETPDGDVLDIDYETMRTTIKEEPINHDELVADYQTYAASFSVAEQANITRIFCNRESKSYPKIKKRLDELKSAAATMPGA